MEPRLVLVSGGARGLGAGIVRRCLDDGHRVSVGARSPEKVREAFPDAGERLRAYPYDADAPGTAAEWVEATARDMGPPDALVNNAGVSLPAPIDGPDFEAQWATTLAVNLTAHTTTIRACLPHLTRNGDGRIVNIASTEGIGGSAYISPYTASKHGVIGLSRSLAVELGPTGVTVNVVCPGPIHTGMTAEIPDEAKQKFARRNVPMKRYGDPEEVAHATFSLCLPAMSYCTGAVVVVDGGFTTKNN